MHPPLLLRCKRSSSLNTADLGSHAIYTVLRLSERRDDGINTECNDERLHDRHRGLQEENGGGTLGLSIRITPGQVCMFLIICRYELYSFDITMHVDERRLTLARAPNDKIAQSVIERLFSRPVRNTTSQRSSHTGSWRYTSTMDRYPLWVI